MMDIFGGLFLLVPVLIGLGFLLVFGGIAYVIVKGISQWSYNNAQPVQSVTATVVAKRTSTSGGGGDSMVSTSYYATFEMPDGQRQEFPVGAQEYGLIVEGDRGMLGYQGTRYKGFQRQRV